MTPLQLSHPDNGVWMCYRHGKLIDTDECAYSIETLQAWKRLAERRAKIVHELGKEIDLVLGPEGHVPLPRLEIKLGGLGRENQQIGEAIRDSCMSAIWGKPIAHAVRDLTIELVRNSFNHGEAKVVDLRIAERSIVIDDDGHHYSTAALSAQSGGGAMAYRALVNNFGGKVVLVHEKTESGNRNRIALLSTPSNIAEITPCTIQITSEQLHEQTLSIIPGLNDCDDIYVLVPPFFALSDVHGLQRILEMLVHGKRCILFCEDLSDEAIRVLAEIRPQDKIVRF
jgi:hypothetical protein